DLRSFTADIRSHGKTLEVRTLGGQTPKGPIRVSGTCELPHLDLRVQGRDVAVDIPKKLQATANLDLAIGGDLEGPDIEGDVRLKNGTYTVPKPEKKKKEKKQKEAAAEVPRPAASGERASALWEGTTMDVRAHWPRNVWYRDGLTKIETSGDLRIQKDEETAMPYLTGTIRIVRGTYDAYGRDFWMNSGDIVFTGPPDINPILNIRAQYQ